MSTVLKDRDRFKKKLKDNAKDNIKKVINGEITSIRGNGTVKIPIESIHIPTIKYGEDGESGGIGRGDGNVGDIVDFKPDPEMGKAGNEKGRHSLYAELNIEELAEMLGEELELPNIQPKGERLIKGFRNKYNTVSNIGPRSLRHKKRTILKTILKQIRSGQYDHESPRIIPYTDDVVYKSWKTVPIPINNAVIFYMMDVSGSMTNEQLEIVKTICFWIEIWLQKFYKDIDVRYILHDFEAAEVDKDRFYTLTPGGGTLISSAFRILDDRMKTFYPSLEWNCYPFYFSDMCNWSDEDDEETNRIILENILPNVNQLSLCMLSNSYTWMSNYKNFSDKLINKIGDDYELSKKVVLSKCSGRNECYDVIKAFLQKGN